MISDVFALDETDDIGFVHQVRPVTSGVLRMVEPREVYVVKIDNWFGEKWLSFSNKIMGALSVQQRGRLRVPPFVPSRVRSQQFLVRRKDGGYDLADSPQQLHIEQSSENNAERLMAVVCPEAAVVWWSASTRANRRGCLMAYLPTDEGHVGWYAEYQGGAAWTVSRTLCVTSRELAAYANGAK